jgi:hypothetical protein
LSLDHIQLLLPVVASKTREAPEPGTVFATSDQFAAAPQAPELGEVLHVSVAAQADWLNATQRGGEEANAPGEAVKPALGNTAGRDSREKGGRGSEFHRGNVEEVPFLGVGFTRTCDVRR